MASAKLPTKPDVEALNNGTYTCSSCVPKISVPADGKPHPVSGHPYYDALAVRQVDGHTMTQTFFRGGKEVSSSTTTVAPDDRTETITMRDTGAANGVPVTTRMMSRRVAPAPAGANAISGSWMQTTEGAQISDSALTFSFASSGNRLIYKTPTGQSYTAEINGPTAPVTGAPGWTGVALKRTGPDTLVETDYRGAKPISVLTMTVTDGGKAMKLVSDDKLHGTTTSYTARRQ